MPVPNPQTNPHTSQSQSYSISGVICSIRRRKWFRLCNLWVIFVNKKTTESLWKGGARLILLPNSFQKLLFCILRTFFASFSTPKSHTILEFPVNMQTVIQISKNYRRAYYILCCYICGLSLLWYVCDILYKKKSYYVLQLLLRSQLLAAPQFAQIRIMNKYISLPFGRPWLQYEQKCNSCEKLKWSWEKETTSEVLKWK